MNGNGTNPNGHHSTGSTPFQSAVAPGTIDRGTNAPYVPYPFNEKTTMLLGIEIGAAKENKANLHPWGYHCWGFVRSEFNREVTRDHYDGAPQLTFLQLLDELYGDRPEGRATTREKYGNIANLSRHVRDGILRLDEVPETGPALD